MKCYYYLRLNHYPKFSDLLLNWTRTYKYRYFWFYIYSRLEFIQPQHIWPYIQHNFIHQSQIQNHGYHINNNQHHGTPPTNGTNSDNDNLQTQQNGIQQQQQPVIDLQDDNRLHPRDKQQQQQQQQLIAKPLASRPAPFIHHGLNHPHLHSLLAHCRNPYITGEHLSI